MMNPQEIITRLDNHHTEKQLREDMISICHHHLPFSLLELERLSAPMMRLFLTGRTGFAIDKAIVTQQILQRLYTLEHNPSRAFELHSVLRDFSTALRYYADKQGVILSVDFSTAA